MDSDEGLMKHHVITLTKGKGSVYNIGLATATGDPTRLWVCLGPLEVGGNYVSYPGQKTGSMSLCFPSLPTTSERNLKIISTIDYMVAETFQRQFENKRCGEIFMTKETLRMIFKTSPREGRLTVKAVPDAVDIFDSNGKLLKEGRIDSLYLIGKSVNVVAEPMFIYVSRDMAVIHWRLRQLRLLSEIDEDGADSDWSL